jgi:predicted metal-dependent hydrolase
MKYDYVLKVSNRAKRVNLRMNAEEGLVVTVPKRYNQKKIHEVFARHEKWLDKMHLRFKDERAKRLAEPLLPEKIILQGIQEEWRIIYEESDIETVRIKEKESILVLYGAVHEQELCLKALRKWLKEKARSTFAPLLDRYAEVMGLSYKGLRVGNQKSRWGSCSSNKGIRLNLKMLFLPTKLMKYVIIHELSHLVHMNHSKSFWRHVAQFEPGYRQLDKELRQSWAILPRFII